MRPSFVFTLFLALLGLQACSATCPTNCDDVNLCTTDMCDASTGFVCSHAYVANCCVTADDCLVKGYGCSDNRCVVLEKESPQVSNLTLILPEKSCDVSCDDKDICTEDVCSRMTAFECRHEPIKDCCIDDGGCKPDYKCNKGKHTCVFSKSVNCKESTHCASNQICENDRCLFIIRTFSIREGGHTRILQGIIDLTVHCTEVNGSLTTISVGEENHICERGKICDFKGAPPIDPYRFYIENVTAATSAFSSGSVDAMLVLPEIPKIS